MASNPRIPEPHDHATMHEEDSQKRHFPVPLIIIIVAAIILAALIWYLPRTPIAKPQPTQAVVPAQPTDGQIQLTNIHLSNSPVGNQIYLDALLHNAGSTTINGVLVNVSFPGSNGQTAGTVQAPVTAITGENSAVGEALVDHPIAPGDQETVRIAVPNPPQGWNHDLPGITVAAVTAVSPKGGSAQPRSQSGNTVKAKPPSQ